MERGSRFAYLVGDTPQMVQTADGRLIPASQIQIPRRNSPWLWWLGAVLISGAIALAGHPWLGLLLIPGYFGLNLLIYGLV